MSEMSWGWEFAHVCRTSHLNKEVVDKALKAHNDTTLQDKLYKEYVKEAEMR